MMFLEQAIHRAQGAVTAYNSLASGACVSKARGAQGEHMRHPSVPSEPPCKGRGHEHMFAQRILDARDNDYVLAFSRLDVLRSTE